MYTSYFGFREEPFNITPDPRFFYANPGHEEAYASLLYGIRQRKGYISLIGEAGTGKTTLLRRVVGGLEKSIRVAFYYYNTTLTFDEFLDFICTSFGLQVKEGRKLEKIQAIDRFLRERLAEGGTGVLIIDEAHHLADEVLENLRLLSNIELDNHKLLQIVLVGQPELEQKLDRPELRQLKQRIAISCRLGRLKPQAVEPFIHYRMQTAGCNRYDVFTPQAIQLIAARSDGIPRIINTICDNSLSAAYQASQQTVSEQVVEKVTAALRLNGSPSPGENDQAREKAKKVNVIRLEEEIWGRRASQNAANEWPEIWVGKRPWGWTRRLHWVGLGTVAALFLLYLANTVFFPQGPSNSAVPVESVKTQPSPSPPQPVSLPSPSASPSLAQSETPDPSQTAASIPPATSTPEPAVDTSQTTAEPATTAIASLSQESGLPTNGGVTPASFPETEDSSANEPALTASPPAAVTATATPGEESPSVQSTVQATVTPDTDSTGQAITVARGDTVSELVLKVYGNYSALALDLIKEFNPTIADLDRILIGQRLVLPSLSRETLLRKQEDGQYRLILGTFVRETEAEKAAQAARSKGYTATVIKRRVAAGARSLYRVELEQLPDTAAVDRAWELVDGART
jgi:general secretion pathway protein A